MIYALLIFADALLCNCIPHVVAGLQGTKFPTPFAKPSGIGHSPPPVNFAWGSANLLLGLFIARRRLPHAVPTAGALALAVGFLAAGTYLSVHFGKAGLTRVTRTASGSDSVEPAQASPPP